MTESYMDKIEKDYIESSFRMAALLAAKEDSEKYMAEVKDDAGPSEAEIERFEKLYDKEMRKKHAKEMRKSVLKIAWHVAVCIMAIVTVGFSLIISVDALRSKFTQLLISFEPEYAQIQMEKTDHNGNIIEGDISAQLTGRYLPMYIPEGFEITSMTMNELLQDTVYENGESFVDLSVSTENGTTLIDTEEADCIETITLNGTDCMLVEKDGFFTLVWANDDEYFVLLTNISKEDTLQIASSVEKVK